MLALLVAAVLLPLSGDSFYVTLATRIMIFSMAAIALDLALGCGGMVSFGHAAFFGFGAYVPVALAQAGVTSAFVAWPLATVGSGLTALVIGALSLRTKGVYFIMITLAFAQMMYYLAVGLRSFGRDDGMPFTPRNDFAGIIDINEPTTFYYVVLVLLVAAFLLCRRLVDSRF